MVEFKDLKINGVYQNKKNKEIYKVLNVARNSETLEFMVVYMALYPNYQIWARPLELFLEKFQIDNGVTE